MSLQARVRQSPLPAVDHAVVRIHNGVRYLRRPAGKLIPFSRYRRLRTTQALKEWFKYKSLLQETS